jgi:hypothetical protein
MLIRLATRGMTKEGARWARGNLMTEALYVIFRLNVQIRVT